MGALWKAWEWSGTLCGGGGREIKAKSSPASLVNHWLFSQNFDKQLKSSKISRFSTACRKVYTWHWLLYLHSPLLTWQQKIMAICSGSPNTKIWITLTTRSGYSLTPRGTRVGPAAALVYKRYRLRGDGSAHDDRGPILTAPQLHSTPAASCNVIVICGELCWKILLLSFSFSWFLYFKDRKQASFEMLL